MRGGPGKLGIARKKPPIRRFDRDTAIPRHVGIGRDVYFAAVPGKPYLQLQPPYVAMAARSGDGADDAAAFLPGEPDLIGPEKQGCRPVGMALGVDRQNPVVERDAAFVDDDRQRA